MTEGRVKCRATSKKRGEHCKRYAIPGGTVCYWHGGNAPQVQRKAAERLVMAEAEQVVRKRLSDYPDTPVTDPLAALMTIAGRMEQVSALLKDRVDALETHLTGVDDKGQEFLRATIAAYMTMLGQSSTTLAAIAKLNIEERMAKVSEAQVMIMMRALEATFAALGITGAQAVTARQVFATRLREVGA